MTGEIITNGTNVFSDIVEKLGNITTEFVPYLIYIGIAILGISLTIKAVKYILNYLKGESKNTFRERINENDFNLNFERENKNIKEIKPTIYKNNYEKYKAKKERIKRNENWSDNVL